VGAGQRSAVNWVTNRPRPLVITLTAFVVSHGCEVTTHCLAEHSISWIDLFAGQPVPTSLVDVFTITESGWAEIWGPAATAVDDETRSTVPATATEVANQERQRSMIRSLRFLPRREP
jgi:hypothetical protein